MMASTNSSFFIPDTPVTFGNWAIANSRSFGAVNFSRSARGVTIWPPLQELRALKCPRILLSCPREHRTPATALYPASRKNQGSAATLRVPFPATICRSHTGRAEPTQRVRDGSTLGIRGGANRARGHTDGRRDWLDRPAECVVGVSERPLAVLHTRAGQDRERAQR